MSAELVKDRLPPAQLGRHLGGAVVNAVERFEDQRRVGQVGIVHVRNAWVITLGYLSGHGRILAEFRVTWVDSAADTHHTPGPGVAPLARPRVTDLGMVTMSTSTEETTASVNGAGPAPTAEPCEDCAGAGDKVMGVLGLAFAALLAAMAFDLLTGGSISRLIGQRGAATEEA